MCSGKQSSDLKLRRTFAISPGAIDVRHNVLVQIAIGGITGLGEAEPVPYYNETAESAIAALEQFDPTPLEGVINGVGVAEIARDKAYRKLADRIAWQTHQSPYNTLTDASQKKAIDEQVADLNGGLKGSCMISDAFFPCRDGAEVGIREGIAAIAQPGGSMRDYESIEACNEADVAMVYTGQRSFRH